MGKDTHSYTLLERLHESYMTFLESTLAMWVQHHQHTHLLAQQIPLLGVCSEETVYDVNKSGHTQT